MATFHDLEKALREWPADIADGSEFEQPNHRRLAHALRSFRENPESVGSGDLAGLIRQLLRRESLEREHDVELEVPATEGWPSREEWKRFGVDVRLDLGERYRVVARGWSPPWAGGDLTDVLAVRGDRRAPMPSKLAVDPLIQQDLG